MRCRKTLPAAWPGVFEFRECPDTDIACRYNNLVNSCNPAVYEVIVPAVMRKLSNIIYAVLRDHKPFELRTPQEHMALLAAA